MHKYSDTAGNEIIKTVLLTLTTLTELEFLNELIKLKTSVVSNGEKY